MLIKDIIDEDFSNYKLPSMFIATSKCDYKCCKEKDLPISICQNSPLARQQNIDISIDFIVDRYIKNNLTSAVVIGGLEPFLQFNDIYNLIKKFREQTQNDIVVYTGYYPEEISEQIRMLKQFSNIIVKFGRFIPNHKRHYDNILGVELASDNQYAEKIS